MEAQEVPGGGFERYMFNMGHQVGYYNYNNLVRVLYLDLNLDHLTPFVGDMAIFLMETHAVNPNPYRYIGSGTPY